MVIDLNNPAHAFVFFLSICLWTTFMWWYFDGRTVFTPLVLLPMFVSFFAGVIAVGFLIQMLMKLA